MVSTMTKRIEMILMMFLVGIYFCGDGSCDGGFNYGCNYNNETDNDFDGMYLLQWWWQL